MRILHVFKTYYPEDFTGIPRVIYELAEGLSSSGVETHVLALYEKTTDVPLKLGRHYVHRARRDFNIASTGISFEVFKKFRSLVDISDVVNYHFPWPLADFLYFSHGFKKPSVVTYHSDIVKQRHILPFYAPLMHLFLSHAQIIVATSPNYVDTSTVLERHRKKVSVIPIGIQERVEPDANHVNRWKARLGEDFFLFIGALRYYKGLPFLLEAARQSKSTIVIVGGPTEQKFEAPENVVFVGEVSDNDREALLSLCRALVLPSHLRSEAFGIVLLEAMRAGKPMITCEIGTGTSYLNIDKETGIVVPPANPQALATAILALANDLQKATAMGRNARARYDLLFRAEEMCVNYLKIYRQLATSRNV